MIWVLLVLYITSFIFYGNAENQNYGDRLKGKKIQIVYIKVPIAARLNNNNNNYPQQQNNQYSNGNQIETNQAGYNGPVHDANQVRPNYQAETVPYTTQVSASGQNYEHENKQNGYNANSGYSNEAVQQKNYPEYNQPMNEQYGNSNGYNNEQFHHGYENSQYNYKDMTPQTNSLDGKGNGYYNKDVIRPQDSYNTGYNQEQNIQTANVANNYGNMMSDYAKNIMTEGDTGLGAMYDAASQESLPYPKQESNENFKVQGNEYMGEGPVNYNAGDSFEFSDMPPLEGLPLMNFGGGYEMTGAVPEDYAKGTEKRGRFMGLMSNAASAISKLNSFSFLPSMNSYNSLGGVGMNYYPMKGLAMSMSSNYPTFAGPKVQAAIPAGTTIPSGFGGGFRSRLTSLLNGRLSSFSLGSLGNLSGSLLGMMGFR